MVDLSVGLQRPMGWGRAQPCRNCGALVFDHPLCQICTGTAYDGNDEWPAEAVVPS